MKYHLVTDYDLPSFEERATDFLNSGWEPVGGVAVHTTRSGLIVYSQAFKKLVSFGPTETATKD